ncbi:MAG: DUF547 domain-containing protein, partial [Saprospiraceae bacterium]|nr:DUF547 domain-containing protein [Saprospiraceae bacterium]
NKAYTANNLDMMLQERTKTFINNPDYNQIQPSKISISKIFDWYQSDFKDVISFLNNYSSSKINSSANISYLEYDWALNKQ